ncbi:hypothetical protein [Octadecabacter antarcticus]|uniref:hypothetical protein n=1 Tax=Octadecabacter antarcticus TaxID=1217908 RepID=UPI0011818BFE|nr:hypothetical protein [Octadecabacter antarcticus]
MLHAARYTLEKCKGRKNGRQIKNEKFMLIKQCKGCRYLIWNIGVGQGVKCSNRKNWDNDKPPQIGSIQDCQLYEASLPCDK